jgi:hypothetical protein
MYKMEETKMGKIKRYIEIFLSFLNIVNWYYFIKRFFINIIMKEKFLRYYSMNFHELYKLLLVEYTKENNGYTKTIHKKRTVKYILTKLCTSNDIELKKLGISLSEGENIFFGIDINYTNFLNLRKSKYEEFYKEAENNINRVINFIIGALVIGLANGFFSNYFKTK